MPRHGQPDSNYFVTSPDFQQMQDAREQLLALEREQRQLIGSGLRTLQFSPSSCEPPTPTRLDHPRSSQSSLGGGLPHENRGGDTERPAWLLADGRLRAARLEGENHALRRAVARARFENDELAARRRAAEERSEALERENRAASEALRRTALLQQSPSTGSGGRLEAWQTVLPGPGLTAETAPTVSLSPTSSRRPDDNAGQRAHSEEARSRLLHASLAVGRRMEEILARHSALHALRDVVKLGDHKTLGDCHIEVGSTAASGESAEGYSTC